MASPFLTAQWRKLLLVNYAVEKHHLVPYVPWGTELITFNDICYLSVVGFMFEDVRMKGIPVPFHQSFPEINLRFYVKHVTKNGAVRTGVVFLKEFAPKPVLGLVANTVYHEHYETPPMDYQVMEKPASLEVKYTLSKGRTYSMEAVADKTAYEIPRACEEEFITEHTWGYTAISKYETNVYEVWHPRWSVYPVQSFRIDFDFAHLYGEEFAFLQQLNPFSVMLAEGSEIRLWKGTKLK